MGDGWSPAVINDRMEFNFIREAQRGLTDNRSYWIGGSTNAEDFDTFGLTPYMDGDLGYH